ncbi:hypothetical protein IE993_24710 [Klebsiella pneumoniae]|nr:hypothetical protein [Klebsiella pneumoniae]
MPDLLLQFCRPGKAPAATRHKAAPCPAALRMPGLLLRFCRPGKAPAATRHKVLRARRRCAGRGCCFGFVGRVRRQPPLGNNMPAM